MKANETKITPVRLRLELKDGHLSDYEKRMLMRYGESKDGASIVRDILVPSDMPLHNLHYAIQKLFGWQNSHLRSFTLPEDLYGKLTSGTVKGWAELAGVLFQPPSAAEGDAFWDDDYESGSFNTWLRKKYKGPYVYGGKMEHFEAAKQDVQELLDGFPMIDIHESFGDYMTRKRQDENEEIRIIKRAPLAELTLEEMTSAIAFDDGVDLLLERLKVNELLACQDESVTDTHTFPVTAELRYEYDYGDSWNITITKYKDCSDLLCQNLVGEEELEEAERAVIDKHTPVCIYKEGLNVLDDIGGLGGFARFLGTIYEGEDKEEAADARRWAKSFGWNAAKMAPRKML